jgi:co-chaperonin GroES (HSP10)
VKVQPIYDRVLVEVESEWKEEIRGKNGVIGIVFQDDIDRSVGAQRKGVLRVLPRAMSKNHHLLSRVKDQLQVGDTLYFHFNSVTEDSRFQPTLSDKPLYVIPMDNIFCAVRNGEIIMYGGRVLCEPVFDEDVVEDGGIKVRKTKSGIISEINVGHNVKVARLAHIGNPLANDPQLDVSPGENVFYDVDSDFENEIEGKEFFCMIQEDLLMKKL